MKKEYLTLDEIHVALTNILAEFDRVCRENNLRYTISSGTLIGAVRHKGFIPWDDDVDVHMPRPDYEKLYALVKSGEIKLGEHFLLSEDRGKNAYYPFFKLMDDRYSVKTWENKKEVPYLYVDVFPMDGAPDSEKEVKKLRKRRLRYLGICALDRWAVPPKKWTAIYRFLFFPFYIFGNIYGSARASRKLNHYTMQNDFNTCKQCGVFSFGLEKWLMDSEKFSNLIELPFENIKVLAIADYDEWLTMIYGDYMTPPPENKRVSHSLKVWKNNNAEIQ